jgi:Bacterial pre-peptidase C-terminal domain
MRTETTHREDVAVKRILSLALVAALAACDRATPAGAPSSSGILTRIVRGLGVAKTDPLTLRIDLYPTVLPNHAFRIEVSYRDGAGNLMDLADHITLRLDKNTLGASLSGTLMRPAVHGIATFDDLAIDTVGDGYTITAKSPKAATVTSTPFGAAYSVVAPQQTAGSTATAQPISPNVPELGSLGPGHVDYYRFRGTVGEILTVSSYANRLDLGNWDTSLRLRLIAPDGTTEIARSGAPSRDAHGVDNGFAMLRLPQEGDYYLACDVDQEGFLTGAYGVLLTLSPDPGPALQVESEPWGTVGGNDTPATAQALSPGLLYGHFDTPPTNATASDFYKIAIASPTRIHVELIAARNGAAYGDVAWDPRLELQDSSGAVLWSNDNSYGLDPAIDYAVTVPGTYYVRVTRSESPSNTGASPYFVAYSALAYSPLAQVAGNTTAAAAMPIGYGADVAGSFATAGDRYFAFGGTAGDVVSLAVGDRSGLQGASLNAPDVVLLATDGTTALSSGSTTGSAAESKPNLRQTILQTTGTFLVRVRSATAGSFGLRLDRLAASDREVEPNDSAAQANPVGASGWVSGAIGAAGDQDHFLVHAEAGELVTVSLLAAPGLGRGTALSDWGSALMPKLEVRDANGHVLSLTAADRKGSFNFAESAQLPRPPMIETAFRAPVAGDYDVVVSDSDGQGGPTYFYGLHVWGNK